ncbi:hypothetical protein VTN31DRAFT_7416 [Thermomyces dupontii]|uniref:uncharacterized protein n=1 Tax=Talaromyces thermophilus TaxID=28565 RepID=UPI00374491FA
MEKISITICGDGGCGKSSITLRLVRGQWTDEYDPTIEDSYSVTRTVNGTDYLLSITDTAGQEEYRSLWATSNLRSDAFVLVYDITNPSSLDALDYFMDMLDIEREQREENTLRLVQDELNSSKKNKGAGGGGGGDVDLSGVQIGMPPPVRIVVGNKCDLKDARAVEAKQGLEYARARGAAFMETSAREMVNIEETFSLLILRVIEAREQHNQFVRDQLAALTGGGSTSNQNGNTHSNGKDSGGKRGFLSSVGGSTRRVGQNSRLHISKRVSFLGGGSGGGDDDNDEDRHNKDGARKSAARGLAAIRRRIPCF